MRVLHSNNCHKTSSGTCLVHQKTHTHAHTQKNLPDWPTIRLPGLSNKNIKSVVKFEFQINKYFYSVSMSQITYYFSEIQSFLGILHFMTALLRICGSWIYGFERKYLLSKLILPKSAFHPTLFSHFITFCQSFTVLCG